ncbi:adenine deaminase [Acetobacterium tundrae]|uniref:Adenine deaminase n=1 Tax=Acetobacterium tundrae TaxID=132932 RepID=A0ABR6WL14_9FIRM|nr:adenine deaminase [Acetobacterium tundrae]MBC3797131.1 adenine deaminase [Acetobacterium tundrae]
MNKTNQIQQKNIAISNGFEKADLVLKRAKIINLFSEEIQGGDLAISNGFIVGIGQYDGLREIDCSGKFISPGFIDAHMHIESTMVTPLELAKAILPSGTTTIIADPHEIVNMAGKIGLDYLLNTTENIPLNVYIMLPSSVPATEFETNGSGAFLVNDMNSYLNHPRILGLGEVMCFPNVLAGDPVILEKLTICRDKICDGHAPGLSGKALQAYACAGIESDHESTSFEEAYEKLAAGILILIREGSAAKNLYAIVTGLLDSGLPMDRFLFCTDDKHLEDIHRDGHIRWNIKMAIELGMDPIKAIKIATLNAAQAYGLKRLGAIAPGYRADLVILSDLQSMTVESVYKDGKPLAQYHFENTTGDTIDPRLLNSVHIHELSPAKLKLPVYEKNHVIELIPNQIETNHLFEALPSDGSYFVPNETYAKLCVIERHRNTGNVGVAAIKGFGIKKGAIATTVAHDSHNIIVVGDNDADILLAVDCLAKIKGGYVVVSEDRVLGSVPLPIAGLMSLDSGEAVQKKVASLIAYAHDLGIPTGVDPFITLSFMALPVIPSLRLTDLGLFDVNAFALIKYETD